MVFDNTSLRPPDPDDRFRLSKWRELLTVKVKELLSYFSGAFIVTSDKEPEVTDSAKGLILKSPDGTRWRIQVNNSGTVTTTSL